MITVHDFIVVGGGAAGCVLAARLSARPEHRVLLLEAGGRDNRIEIQIPAAFTKLFRTARDWAFETTPQPAMAGRALYWPRGKMLGGSSSMNAQMYVRGHRADYDGWASSGCAGWSWDDVRPAFERAEGRTPNPHGLYGSDGPQAVSDQRDPNVTTYAFMAACREIGMRRLRDLNDADNEGVAPTPVTQRRGRRWSAADAYLRPALKRPNLRVMTDAHVRRVIFEGRRAVGVEYVDAAGYVHTARASREVVLAAGAIGSPHLLMLSGVGPAADLTGLGIPVVADRASVGENLQDHLLVGVIRACTPKVTLVHAESPLSVLRYLLQKKGGLTSCVGEAVAFVRSDASLPAPDLELIFAPVPYIDHGAVKPAGDGTSIGVVLLQPASRGRIRLASPSPRVAPQIDAGYLSDPGGKDLATLILGIRKAQQIYGARALAPYAGAPIEPGPGATTDNAIERFVREQAETIYHPVGTCRMGADDASVVDLTLRVRAVEGLRVADASIMPRINRGHTYAPTIMIAERAAAMILADAAHRAERTERDERDIIRPRAPADDAPASVVP
jgi:choline dehydrogenase